MNSGEKERARPLFICARWEDSVTFKRAFTFLASTDAKTMHNRTWGDDFTRSLTKAEERGKVKTKGESRTSESSLQIAVDNTTLHDLGITYRYSVLSTSLRTPPSSPALPSDVMPSSPAPTYLSFAVYSKPSKNVTMEGNTIFDFISISRLLFKNICFLVLLQAKRVTVGRVGDHRIFLAIDGARDKRWHQSLTDVIDQYELLSLQPYFSTKLLMKHRKWAENYYGI